MNVITNGNTLSIFGENDVDISKEIPVGVYDVCFSKFQGNFLKRREDTKVTEKVYGSHTYKANKAINAFKISKRSLGVMLCGDKGIGKTLFVKVLNEIALSAGFPVLICTNNCPGLVDFLGNITQEVVVVFDEFEKNFKDYCNDDDCEGSSEQEQLLTMFDGLDATKKLYVITCNNIYKVNDYMVDRPGRFHYRFELKNPSPEEITEYLTDNLKPEYHDVINRVVNYSVIASVTFDWLRAIAFELNCGYPFEEVVEDLNISNSEELIFTVVAECNGVTYTGTEEIEYGNNYSHRIRLYAGSNQYIRIRYSQSDLKIVPGGLTIDVDKVPVLNRDDDEVNNDLKLTSIKFYKDVVGKKTMV